MHRIKVLQIGAENFGHGGRSVIAYGLTKYMPSDIQNDFLAYTHCIKNRVTDDIETRGNIVWIDSNYIIQTIKMIRKNKYDIVHIHADNAYEALKMALLSKLGNGKAKIVVHGHSTSTNKSLWFKTLMIKISRLFLGSVADLKIAVSKEAAVYMYGYDKDIQIIKDGIDLKNYGFNPLTRDNIRKELKIDNDFVIGNVGRLTYQKNQKFLINIFKELLRVIPNSKLLLIGDGPDRKDLVNKITDCHLEKKVLLLGNRDDVPDLLQAMDFFVFPSKYEGFGIAALESQASSLPTLVSDVVPDSLCQTRLCSKMRLSEGCNSWSKAIIEKCITFEQRIKVSSKIQIALKKNGFDLFDSSMKLLKMYRRLVNAD